MAKTIDDAIQEFANSPEFRRFTEAFAAFGKGIVDALEDATAKATGERSTAEPETKRPARFSPFEERVIKDVAGIAASFTDETVAYSQTGGGGFVVLAVTEENPERFAQLRALHDQWYPDAEDRWAK